MNKHDSRIRRAKRTRYKVRELEVVRLSVHKTPRHMYAQVMSPCGGKTLVSASTLDKEIKTKLKSSGNKDAAVEVGKLIAKRALDAGIKAVAFDRSGSKYHGRIEALANAARETGLEF